MDSRYHEFVWLTVKEYFLNCAIGSAILALCSAYCMAHHIVFVVAFTLCLLFSMVFTLGNRMAHYVAKVIKLEREETASSESATVTN